MKRIICAETRECLTNWDSLDAIKQWASLNHYPFREENGTLIVETNDWDIEEGEKVPATCVYRVQEVAGGPLA